MESNNKTGTQVPPQKECSKPPSLVDQMQEMELMPQRNIMLHWFVFALSIFSLGMLIAWIVRRGPVSPVWVALDIGLGVILALEFFTRDGFRWQKFKYLRSHFFDFVAIVPVLALVQHGFFAQEVWLWLVLVARSVRVIDRFLGDGFVQRNILALRDGFEEEISDRVLERLVARIQADLDRAEFSHGIATALSRNKTAVLERIHAATPNTGIVPGLAHLVKLDAALERAEARTFDAIVEILDSPEIDHAVRDAINTSCSRIRNELGDKSWRRQIGLRRRQAK